ncbi:MAG TPA: C45 family autoproteolytic acyltransferase/hydrolase [Bryobacteraceae bacterium]|nr:C45 family autoproteolytic acyltransferase/hydrolase [Bryobacteraceae bacterium]
MRALLVSFVLLAPLYSATPLFEGSFENPTNGWTTLRGAAASDSVVTYQNHNSLRLEPGNSREAAVQSAPISLAIGKRYELTGWIRTAGLTVRDLDRSPIAVGAALSMASMPFDVHSESVGGSNDWTRVHLRFTATRPQDHILLSVANGGAFEGQAWFAGVSIDAASSKDDWPAPAAVATYGPAYRYPAGGWIYLHIQGQPYERGYQHGRLMSREIVQYMERCAAELDHGGKKQSWNLARTTAASLFLHGFDQEILEEMKGIADGASDAGARWDGRRIDLTDLVVVNTTVELGELSEALTVTPSGLEGLHLDSPVIFDRRRGIAPADHCSAFAATGKATRDGRMVIGHVTWWPLTLAEQTNVMLDLQPAAGHRILIQGYPGAIESGTDWYQNDAGVVLTETTIRQGPFNRDGTPVAYRARKAIQYGDNIDQVVGYLSAKNNGLYTNEWLIGDAKNNEIALFELGTYKTRLYRSSKHDWFGGTEGFYWGNNNVKDLSVRLEYEPDPNGPPVHVPYVPTDRDLKWQQLYREYNGQIDEQFGFLAFRTAPLVSPTTMDAKVATADMASRMMLWAAFGKPNQREWVPTPEQKETYAKNDGLYPSGYRMIAARSSAPASMTEEPEPQSARPLRISSDRLWKGWVLPASDADTWFTSGSAAYYRDLKSGDLNRAIAAHWAGYRSASAAPPDPIQRFEIETHQGALFLEQLRREMGDNRFFQLMKDFFAAHATQTVTAQSFLDAAGVKFAMPPDPGGAMYLLSDIRHRLATAILVYGTVADAGANRYTAEQLQKQYLDTFESAVPIRKDFEVAAAELSSHDLIFVGRPESNSALAAWKEKIGLDAEGEQFRILGSPHASETEALAFAAANPLDRRHMVLVLAGNNALATVRLLKAPMGRTEYAIFDSESRVDSGFLK